MKIKYYIKLIPPICFFGFLFRLLEIIFAIEPGTGLYVMDSVIPILYNIYVLLAAIFFLSLILMIQKEQKPLLSNIRRLKFNLFDNITVMLASIFLLTGAMKNFLLKLLTENIYVSPVDMFKDLNFYVFIFAILSAFFLIQLISSPKRITKSNVQKVVSISVTVYYILRLFLFFTSLEAVVSKAYGTFFIIFMSLMCITFLNFSKLLAGVKSRKFLMSFGLLAFFFVIVRGAEVVLSLFPENPYQINVDIITYLGDLFTSLSILLVIVKLTKKPQLSKNKLDSQDQQETEEDVNDTFTE